MRTKRSNRSGGGEGAGPDDEAGAADASRVGPVPPPPRTPSLRTRALQHLARREHSRDELARKLAPHVESAEALEALLDDLVRRGQLSDARYAEARSTQLARKFGPSRIAHELRSKGVDAEAASQALAVVRENAQAQATVVWGKRFGRPPSDALERVKQLRFMQMRGFSQDVIQAVVPRVARNGDPEATGDSADPAGAADDPAREWP